jgi:hypothetical protein
MINVIGNWVGDRAQVAVNGARAIQHRVRNFFEGHPEIIITAKKVALWAVKFVVVNCVVTLACEAMMGEDLTPPSSQIGEKLESIVATLSRRIKNLKRDEIYQLHTLEDVGGRLIMICLARIFEATQTKFFYSLDSEFDNTGAGMFAMHTVADHSKAISLTIPSRNLSQFDGIVPKIQKFTRPILQYPTCYWENNGSLSEQDISKMYHAIDILNRTIIHTFHQEKDGLIELDSNTKEGPPLATTVQTLKELLSFHEDLVWAINKLAEIRENITA